MNAALLLREFDRTTDAPDAVSRMRRFVLALAVRGRLSDQALSDVPVSQVVRELKAARNRVRASRHELPPLTEENMAFVLPNSWEWIRLGDVCEYDAGDKRNASQLDPDSWLLELEDVERDTSMILAFHRVKDRNPQSTKSAFNSGDVLYGKLRPYLNKVVVAREAGYSTTEIVAIRPFVPMCPEYICLALRRPDFVDYVTQLGRGTKMPRLRTQDALLAPFPLPPIAEQYRIVAKVDELMALCDQLQATQLERERRRNLLAAASLRRLGSSDRTHGASFSGTRFAIDHLPRFLVRPDQVAPLRESLLALALEGRLVPQDPREAPVTDALTKADAIRADTARSDRRADAQEQVLLAADRRWSVPVSWAWRGLADLVLFIDYRGKTPIKASGGIRLLTAKNVRRGFINPEPEEFISQDEFDHWMTRGLPRADDVLFTTEAPMGNASTIRVQERVALAQRIIAFRSYGAIDPDFLVLQLLSPRFQEILDRTATGLTAKGIKAAKLKRLPIAIPPFAEQRRIVTKVHELMGACDELQFALTSSQAGSSRLLEALLREALQGSDVREHQTVYHN